MVCIALLQTPNDEMTAPLKPRCYAITPIVPVSDLNRALCFYTNALGFSVEASDSDNDSLQIQWTQIAGPQVSISGATSSEISFTAPSVESNQTIAFQVRVSDGTKEIAITTELTVLSSESSSSLSESDNGESGGGSMSNVALLFVLLIAVLRRINCENRYICKKYTVIS